MCQARVGSYLPLLLIKLILRPDSNQNEFDEDKLAVGRNKKHFHAWDSIILQPTHLVIPQSPISYDNNLAFGS